MYVAASMGVSEGKSVGEWFGPNTIMQVFRSVSVSGICLLIYSTALLLLNIDT